MTAAIPAFVPLIEIPGADSGDASADADANHWDEILHWDDDQCDVNLMICAASSHGGPDHVWKLRLIIIKWIASTLMCFVQMAIPSLIS